MSDAAWTAAEERLAVLAQEYALGPGQVASLRELLVVFETDPHAATTIREPNVAVDRHLADALSGLQVDAVSAAESLVDIGTGAGVPSLVLAVARPECQVVALDTVGRKVSWVLGIAERLGITNLRGVHARAEDWPAGLGANDVVTARAVAPLGVLVEYAAPLLRVGGCLVAWKGGMDAEERRSASVAVRTLAMESPMEIPVVPWSGARDHRFVVVEKRRPTPKGFPRRVGLAKHQPLG